MPDAEWSKMAPPRDFGDVPPPPAPPAVAKPRPVVRPEPDDANDGSSSAAKGSSETKGHESTADAATGAIDDAKPVAARPVGASGGGVAAVRGPSARLRSSYGGAIRQKVVIIPESVLQAFQQDRKRQQVTIATWVMSAHDSCAEDLVRAVLADPESWSELFMLRRRGQEEMRSVELRVTPTELSALTNLQQRLGAASFSATVTSLMRYQLQRAASRR